MHAGRQTLAEVGHGCEKEVRELFDVLAARHKDRHGGYLRIIKAGFRHRDWAPIAVIEFVDR